MPVSSPYAVFRASDLLWPALPPQPLKRPAAAAIRAPAPHRWPAVIQGELFPLKPGSASRRSTARRSSP